MVVTMRKPNGIQQRRQLDDAYPTRSNLADCRSVSVCRLSSWSSERRGHSRHRSSKWKREQASIGSIQCPQVGYYRCKCRWGLVWQAPLGCGPGGEGGQGWQSGPDSELAGWLGVHWQSGGVGVRWKTGWGGSNVGSGTSLVAVRRSLPSSYHEHPQGPGTRVRLNWQIYIL